MRPSTLFSIVVGVILAIDAAVLGILAFGFAEGGKPWHYWIAPLLALGLGSLLAALAVGYFVRVGALEMKARPRGE